MLKKNTIRKVFMRNGFTVKEGQTDLKDYVYSAANELMQLVTPLVSQDENNNVTFEWWAGDRKITMYPAENILLRVWGLDIDTEMEEFEMKDPQKVRDSFLWLFGEDNE